MLVERKRINNLTANFSETEDQWAKISVQICSGNLHPTENAFFRRGKGLEKNYDLTGIGIGQKLRSGLRD